MPEIEQKKSGSNSLAIACAAASVLAAGGAVAVTGYGTGLDIPEGSIGLKNTPSKYEAERKVAEVPPGFYWYGSLRFPDLRVVKLGAEEALSLRTTLTPATIDKAITAAQKSLIAHKVLGDRLKNAESNHLEVESEVKFKFPSGLEVDKFLDRVSSSRFEHDVEAACNAALKAREDLLNRKYFKPDMDKVNAEMSAEIAKALGLDSVAFQVTKVTRISKSDRDFAADRDQTRRKVDGVVTGTAEVLFEIGAAALFGR